MNKRMKRRLIVVSGVIVVVLLVAFALLAGAGAAKSATVTELASGQYANQKVKVSGTVVSGSIHLDGNTLGFLLTEPDTDGSAQLQVCYEGAVSATFGNEITAICTGRMAEDGVLNATELMTKCPSKYEDSSEALSVSRLLEYGEQIIDKPVKVTGKVKAATLAQAGKTPRFVLLDNEGAEEIPVYFDGALSEEIGEGTALVLTGVLDAGGSFVPTEVALVS